jgi:chromosome segregation ATPase
MGNAKTSDERYLHSQIEDLLTALSELQRNHALLSNQLQSEREEREEDRKAVRSLLDGLRKRVVDQEEESKDEAESEQDQPPVSEAHEAESNDETCTMDDDSTTVTESVLEDDSAADTPSTEDLSELLDRVENRFAVDNGKRRSSMLQSKTQLREELLNTKGQLASALSDSRKLGERIHDMDQELSALKEQLRERHGHVRTLHQDKQRLEKQIHGMRTRVSSCTVSESSSRDTESEWPYSGRKAGLRELKLGRSKSTPQAPGYSKRLSSLPQNVESVLAGAAETAAPPNDSDALLLELVRAKTAEATAKQEAEEAKQKLETLRKTYISSSSESNAPVPTSTPLGVFSRLTGQATTPPAENTMKPAATVAGTPPNSGGFWGWRR